MFNSNQAFLLVQTLKSAKVANLGANILAFISNSGPNNKPKMIQCWPPSFSSPCFSIPLPPAPCLGGFFDVNFETLIRFFKKTRKKRFEIYIKKSI